MSDYVVGMFNCLSDDVCGALHRHSTPYDGNNEGIIVNVELAIRHRRKFGRKVLGSASSSPAG
jgi:hypothetical protein